MKQNINIKESIIYHFIKYIVIFALAFLVLSIYTAPAIMALLHINANIIISLLGASFITSLGYSFEHKPHNLKYFVFAALLALSFLGLLSINQLILVSIVFDSVLLWRNKTFDQSLLLLPLELVDKLSNSNSWSSLVIGTIFALSWAAGQTILTMHFLPELIGYLGSLIGIVVPLLQLKIAIILLATFTTIFFLARKNLNHEISKEVIDKTTELKVQIAKTLLLGFMYWSVKGYALEWVKYFSLYMPHSIAITVAIIAGLTLAHFIAKRVNETVDVIAASNEEGNSITFKERVWLAVPYVAICTLVFSILNIIPFSLSLIVASSAIIVIVAAIEYKIADPKKYEEDGGILNNLFNRLSLLSHAAGESLVPVAGMQGTMPSFMLPIAALVLTMFEVLADSNHDENHDEFSLPNLKKLAINMKTVSNYVSDAHTFEALGYTKEDYEVTPIPGLGWATRKSSKNKLENIAELIKGCREKITLKQAINLILTIHSKFSAQDLLAAGFTKEEIINSKIFSKTQLGGLSDTSVPKNYKAKVTELMVRNLAKNSIIKAEDLITAGFTEEEIIDSKIFSKTQLQDLSDTSVLENYKAKVTKFMAGYLVQSGIIKAEYLIDAGFTEEEIIDSKIFTTKQLRTLGLNGEYYSSQLSFALILTLVSVVFINYNPILLAVGLIATLYYSYKLYTYDAANTRKSNKLKMMQNHFVAYASYITAFSLSVNGGMECLDVFGCSIYIALALALFGAVIESSVYFDELMKEDGGHSHDGISDYLPDLKGVLAYSALFVVSVALYNVAMLLSLPIGLIAQIAVIILPLTFYANYDKMHAIAEAAVTILNSGFKNINEKSIIVTLIMLANIIFSIFTTLGYSMAFMPVLLPIMILALNISLLLLFNNQAYNAKGFLNLDNLRNNFCANQTCRPAAKTQPRYSSSDTSRDNSNQTNPRPAQHS